MKYAFNAFGALPSLAAERRSFSTNNNFYIQFGPGKIIKILFAELEIMLRTRPDWHRLCLVFRYQINRFEFQQRNLYVDRFDDTTQGRERRGNTHQYRFVWPTNDKIEYSFVGTIVHRSFDGWLD